MKKFPFKNASYIFLGFFKWIILTILRWYLKNFWQKLGRFMPSCTSKELLVFQRKLDVNAEPSEIITLTEHNRKAGMKWKETYHNLQQYFTYFGPKKLFIHARSLSRSECIRIHQINFVFLLCSLEEYRRNK